METSIAWLLLTVSACQALPQYPPTTTTTPHPPKPFKYAFSSGRVPGGPPDRYIQSEGDSRGVIRGGFAYLDPNFQWQQVEYVADENGFHVDSSALPVANPVSHPQDTAAVAKAKAAHQALFEQIALRNSEVPVVQPNAETPAVASHRDAFHKQFEKIAAEHARIAEEHERLAELEKKERELAQEQRLAYI